MYYEVTGSMKVQADVFEAILGAIFIDQGLLKAKEFVQKHLLSQISNKSLVISDHKDPKTELQEHFQSFSRENISYFVEEKENKTFEAKAIHNKNIYGIILRNN
ncbi:hypothetical protein [Mycoplasmopsis cynos]|uniref:hypothetical protein n=1 Tax=Mycoplasmopsis cynos TaxID=171284 RepID=UPI003A5C7B32